MCQSDIIIAVSFGDLSSKHSSSSELVYSLSTDSQVSRSTVPLNFSCVGFLQMLYVILSRQYVKGNSNKMNLESAKFAALEASFYKLLWLKDPQSGNDDMTNPDVHMSFVHARLELCF